MRIALASFLIFCVSLTLAAQSAPNATGDAATILALENAWNQAEEHKDARALDELLADSLVYTDWDGSFVNKSGFLDSAKNSPVQDMVLVNDDVHVDMYGDSAVVTGVYHEKGQERGRTYARTGRFTDTWVKQKGTWLCVASQSTLVAAK
ncbi:MAG TPA: nuclear transport factor 2 family protein [Verrucomicrobiae bacterium]|nr:nuclear transport factor 2 family protein [Verrucomicrobiae bacterium]